MLSTATKIRIARAIYKSLAFARSPLGGGDRVEVTRGGVRWHLDLREGIDLTIYLVGAFEKPTLRQLQRLVRPGMNVVDIGANIGAHTLHLARAVGPSGSVIAFEPTSFAVAKLRTNLGANPDLAPRVVVHQTLLVDKRTSGIESQIASSWPVDDRRPDDAEMGSIGMSTDGATAATLDDAITEAGTPPIHVIKMDVDGHELKVLKGAMAVLKRDTPTIVMELAPYVFKPAEDFDAVLGLLWDLDYDLTPIGTNKTLPRDVAAVRGRIPLVGSLNVTAAKRR